MLDTRPRFCYITARENVFENVKHDVVCVITGAVDVLGRVGVRLDKQGNSDLPPASRPHEIG